MGHPVNRFAFTHRSAILTRMKRSHHPLVLVAGMAAVCGHFACGDASPSLPGSQAPDAGGAPDVAEAGQGEAGPDVSVTDAAGSDSGGTDSGAEDGASELDAVVPEASATDVGVEAAAGPIRCLTEDASCSYAFSMGRLTENPTPANDEFVQIGFYRFEPSQTATACSFTGPKALKLYWHWGPGNRPAGTCTSDNLVSVSRWDHAGPDVVDNCPSAASWAPNSAVLHGSCPAHITAGFGRSASMITFTGNYEYDAAAGTMTFRWLDLKGVCRKEYWNLKRVATEGGVTELVSLELDGARTGDTTTKWRGTGNTHGFALGSSQSTTAWVPQDVVAERYSGSTVFTNSDYSFYGNVISYASGGGQGSWQRCGGHPNVLFQYSCHKEDANTTPDLVACNKPDANGNDSGGAYLKYIADAFASNSRYNVWYSFHALLTQGAGCYHRGLHSYPLIQVMGSSGAFRGWVGIEYQESDKAMDKNLYHVMRKVEEGYY